MSIGIMKAALGQLEKQVLEERHVAEMKENVSEESENRIVASRQLHVNQQKGPHTEGTMPLSDIQQGSVTM